MSIIELIQRAKDSVPETIEGLLAASGYNQSELGRELGIHRSIAQQRVKGVSKWQYEELLGVAEFFEVPIDLLYMDPNAAVIRALEEYDLRTLRERRRITDQGIDASGCMAA